MSTLTKLGIRVYTELGQTGGPPPPKNWWDLDGILKNGIDANQGDLAAYFEKILKQRIPPKGSEEVEERLKNFVAGKLTQDDFFRLVFVDLYATHTNGNNLKAEKSAGSVANLTGLEIGGSYGKAITGAMTCADDGCKAYQKETLALLKDRKDVRVNAYASSAKERQTYGQTLTLEKIKFNTQFRRNDKRPQINALFASDKYLSSSTHARHVEVLSGILFEAGNVFSGNYGRFGDSGERVEPTQGMETEVFAHNARQVMGIANSGYPITQTDWRNIMALLLSTDINITTFKCTQMAIKVFEGSKHDVSSNLKIAYK